MILANTPRIRPVSGHSRYLRGERNKDRFGVGVGEGLRRLRVEVAKLS